MDFEFKEVDALEKVPEQFRGLYAEADEGKFVPNENYKGVVEAITGLNKSLKAARQEAKTGKVDLTPLSEFGDSPTAIREAIDARIAEIQENAKAQSGTDVQKKLDAAKEALTTAHQTELQKRDARSKALQDQLYTLMVENTATTAIVEQKGVPDLLLPFVKNHTRVTEEDGQFKVHVVDAAGEVRYGPTGSPMSIKELVAEMKADEKYGRLFESETPPGGGFTPGGGNRPPSRQGRELSSTEKIAAGLNRNSHRRR